MLKRGRLKIIELKRNPMMAAHFRTQQVKLGTDEIQYVNMSFDKLGRFGKLIGLGNLG